MDSNKNELNRAYLAMRSRLARIVMRLVPPREVEDIVQETYVRVCQVEKQGLQVEEPRAFLFKTARNLALDYLKRAETRLTVSAEEALESGFPSSSHLTDQIFDQVASDEEFSLFCKAVRELPVQCRRVFVLKKVYGYSQREIARQLGISENTVEGLYQTDTDRTNLSIASLLLSQTQDTFSQELVFSGDTTDRLSWLGGLYYYSSDAAAPFFNSYGGDAPHGPLAFNFQSQVDTTSYSGFGELNYDVTDRLHLTLGVRYTDEEKEYFYGNIFDAMADESESWSNTSYRVVDRYDFSDSSNVYLSDSTGFKSGVYNAYGLPTTGPVEPEEIEAWELGAKARWMGVTFSGAIFAYEYTDIQVQGQTFLPDGTWVVTLNNAAEAEIEGIELSASGPLTDNLSFNIGYSGLPTAEYSDYPTAQVFVFNEATGGTDSVVPFDATGSRIIRAPRHQANAQLVYERTVRQGSLRASVTYSYNDGFFWQPGDLTPEDSFDPINAKVSWTDPRDRYTFSVWGENLTDEQYSVYTATTAAGIADAYTQPLQVGVGISARF